MCSDLFNGGFRDPFWLLARWVDFTPQYSLIMNVMVLLSLTTDTWWSLVFGRKAELTWPFMCLIWFVSRIFEGPKSWHSEAELPNQAVKLESYLSLVRVHSFCKTGLIPLRKLNQMWKEKKSLCVWDWGQSKSKSQIIDRVKRKKGAVVVKKA